MDDGIDRWTSSQELKAESGAFPVNAVREAGYEAVWEGERSWNGVAILARHCSPVVTRRNLSGNAEDRQARYIEAAVNGLLIASIYPHRPAYDEKRPTVTFNTPCKVVDDLEGEARKILAAVSFPIPRILWVSFLRFARRSDPMPSTRG